MKALIKAVHGHRRRFTIVTEHAPGHGTEEFYRITLPRCGVTLILKAVELSRPGSAYVALGSTGLGGSALSQVRSEFFNRWHEITPLRLSKSQKAKLMRPDVRIKLVPINRFVAPKTKRHF